MKQIRWTTLGFSGAIALVVGIIFVFFPQDLFSTAVKGLGILLTAFGSFMLVVTYNNHRKNKILNFYYLLQAIVNLSLGLTMLFRTEQMVEFLMFVIGVWALATGVYQIVFAIKVRKIVNSGMFLLGNGIAFAGLGAIMVIDPMEVIKTLMLVIGSVINLLGFILLYFSFIVYRFNKQQRKMADATPGIDEVEIIG